MIRVDANKTRNTKMTFLILIYFLYKIYVYEHMHEREQDRRIFSAEFSSSRHYKS